MGIWTDQRLRKDTIQYLPSQRAVIKYFARKQEEERLRLKWDNEAMREQLKAKGATKAASA